MKILITAPYNREQIKQLQEFFGHIDYVPWKLNGKEFNEDELLDLLFEKDADGLITELDQVTEKVIIGHTKLKFIGVCRANPVNVDIPAATKRGIPVFVTPARNAQAVAELFIGNVISLLRHTIPSSTWIKEQNWSGNSFAPYLDFKGNELAGRKVGFVGFGAVAQKIANIIKHFPCPIHYYDPFVESDEYESATLEDIFTQSDIVSIHLPVNANTKNMITYDLLKMMKKDAIFVNTARAEVVDYAGLLRLLEENEIRGAILDVFEQEPPSELDYKIIELPHVLATPHIAGASAEVENHHSIIMNENLISWLKNGERKNMFNGRDI